MKIDDISERILDSREHRSSKIEFLKSTFKTLITVKSNVPGKNKKLKISYTLINYFLNRIPKNIYSQKWYYDTFDGPYYILGSNLDCKQIKRLTVDIEDNNPLGRFIDIDVFDGNKPLSRNKLRKCYLCDKDAAICIKENNHLISDLIKHMEDKVLEHLTQETLELISQSIILELNLHPKFGLVTPLTSGSHSDMDYNMMITAKDAIIPFFKDMFIIGFSSNDYKSIFNEIRKVGLNSEKEMMRSTGNTNAYKGLIFNLGITIAAYAYCLYNHIELNNIFDIIKNITAYILLDFQDENDSSFGHYAYKTYHISGARGEMHKGLPSVQKALPYLKDFSQSSRLRTLMYLISSSDDTVLLKRAKTLENFKHIKALFRSNQNSSYKEIEKINSYCINRKLSFGGSADLLVVAIFIKKILS